MWPTVEQALERGPIRSIGIIGGTGPLGQGLAGRMGLAGIEVRLGSREPARAEAVADTVREQVGPAAAPISGVANLEAARSEVVIVAVPFAGIDPAVTPLADTLAGRVVVSVINPMGFDDAGPFALPVEDGSAALAIARRLPEARVTAAFHTLSSVALRRFERPMDDDVLVVGDDVDAVATVADLANRIHGCRGVPAGGLRQAANLERLTPVIIEVNRRYRVHAGIRFTRL